MKHKSHAHGLPNISPLTSMGGSLPAIPVSGASLPGGSCPQGMPGQHHPGMEVRGSRSHDNDEGQSGHRPNMKLPLGPPHFMSPFKVVFGIFEIFSLVRFYFGMIFRPKRKFPS